MLGLSINGTTNTNELRINIPTELIGKELHIIILPVIKEESQPIVFFTQAELQQMPTLQPSTFLLDNEDYSKWQVKFFSKYLLY